MSGSKNCGGWVSAWIGLLCAAGGAWVARAGDLYPAASPQAAGSAMYSIQDVLVRLETGTNAPLRSGAFAQPSAGPTNGAMPTFNDVMAAAPAADAEGAVAADVLEDKTYWGLTEGEWGLSTGTLPTRTLSADNETVEAGYYAATTLSAVDSNLAPGNVVKDVDIFGVVGTMGGVGGGTGVRKTRQTTSYRAGDDGDLQIGIAWPDPRFTNHGNGTVTDHLTSLVWAQNANLGGRMTWSNAVAYCEGLTLGGQTDWRLPQVSELDSLLDLSQFSPALPPGHPFSNVQFGGPVYVLESGTNYWSASVPAPLPNTALKFSFEEGERSTDGMEQPYFVWPVRGGP
jgi:hypothetical protein